MVDREQTQQAVERFERLRKGLEDEFPYISDHEYLETQAARDMLLIVDSYLALLIELEAAEARLAKMSPPVT